MILQSYILTLKYDKREYGYVMMAPLYKEVTQMINVILMYILGYILTNYSKSHREVCLVLVFLTGFYVLLTRDITLWVEFIIVVSPYDELLEP